MPPGDCTCPYVFGTPACLLYHETSLRSSPPRSPEPTLDQIVREEEKAYERRHRGGY